MRGTGWLAMAFFLVCAQAAWAAGAPGSASYEEMVAKLKAGDTGIDYQALRFAFAETRDFDPNARPAIETRDLIRAVNSGNLDDALALANMILDANYTDMNGHYAAYIVFEKSGQHARADSHRAVVEGLMQSLDDSGDGMSEDTAMMAITASEEFAYLGLRGYQVLRQGLSPSRKGPMDVFSVTTRDNQGTTIYFNASRIFAKIKNAPPGGGARPVP